MVQKSIILLLIFIQQLFCAFGIDPRIIGGKKCDYALHPYAVAIHYNVSFYVCGGSLISLEWILTAAHCVSVKRIAKRMVTLTIGMNNHRFVQKRHATKGIPHHKHELRFREARYDIGLLLADKPFEQIAPLVPAKLPSPGFASKCKTVTAIGVGIGRKYKWPEKAAKIIKLNEPLRCVELPIISRDTCSRLMKDYVIDESFICTLDEKGEKDTCFGDYGSPILCKGVVIGVNTLSHCAQYNSPALHIKVEHFLDFITKHTQLVAGGRRMKNSSNNIVSKRVLLIIVFLLHYILFNGFGY